jgi:plasmid maintenance system antidote protein VapI
MSTGSEVGAVARNILDLIDERGQTMNGLAVAIGVPHSTLNRQVKHRPDLLTLSTVLRVAATFDVPVSALTGGIK